MDVIRFQCPACAVNLTVPPEAAGFRGPCPRCSIEIIGPEPARGLPARLTAAEPEPSPEAPPEDPAASTEKDESQDPFADISSNASSGEITWPEKKEAKASVAAETPKRTAEEPSTAESSPPAKTSGASPAVLVLSCMLCAVLAYVFGYSRGNKAPEADSPVFSTLSPDQEDEQKVDVPVRDWIPATDPNDQAPPQPVGPEATLKTFLAAENWKARSNFVMFADQLRPRMEKRAEEFDDGPIEVTGLSRLHINEDSHIFNVSTAKFPKGFPVAVARDGAGWKVDWETFVEFNDDRFKRFASGEGGENGVFHLMINLVNSEEADGLFSSYRLNPPMPDREQIGYVRNDSIALARLRNIFREQAGLPEEEFAQLLEGAGPPLILALSYKTNSQGQSFLQIEDVIAVGWGPGEP